MNPKNRKQMVFEAAAVVARWLLGAMFLYTGASKALAPFDFLRLLRQYDLVHNHWPLNLVAAGVPWFEIFCGLLLLAGIAVRGTALLLTAMLIAFTVLVWHRALVLQPLLHIPFCAVKFDCGCGTGEVYICHKLLENFLLLLLSLWLLAGRGRCLCLRHGLI
ncbi:MAG: DoxX family protein [Verrucomicrobiota bacterium]